MLLIDTIIDVAGSYSRGILYRFGTQLGERYGTRLQEEGMIQEEEMMPILGMLKVSGWFEEYTFRRDDRKAEIVVTRPFEEESRELGCDFMRGFLAGIGSVFSGLPTFYEEEKRDGRVVFIGETEGSK